MHSRPRVSDDNAYAESLFRTAKYRTEFPAKDFNDLEASTWAAGFALFVKIVARCSSGHFQIIIPLSYWVEPDGGGSVPVSCSAAPAFWAGCFGGFIEGLAGVRDGDVGTLVALGRGDEFQR